MIKKFKSMTQLQKQLTVTALCAVLFGVLLLIFFVIAPILAEMLKPVTYSTEIIDGKRVYVSSKGEVMLELLDGEEALTFGTSHRILIAPQVDRKNIKNIQVKNSVDSYKLVHHLGQEGFYFIDGAELVPINYEVVSSFFIDIGYLLSMERVAAENIGDGNEILANLEPFGLSPIEECSYFTVTKRDDEWYKIIIGDKIPTTGGYYIMYEDKNGVRPAIYIVQTTIDDTILSTRYSLMLPVIAETIPSNHYWYSDFRFYKNNELLVEIYNAPELNPEMGVKYQMSYPAPYAVSDNFISSIMSAFNYFAGERVVYTFDPDTDEDTVDEILSDYGFDEPAAIISFDKYKFDANMPSEVDDVSKYLVFERNFYFVFSKPNENGNYYVLTEFDSIVEITPEMLMRPEQRLPFIQWDIIRFVEKSIFRSNINDIGSILIKAPGKEDVLFTLEGTGQDLIIEGNGNIIDVPNFRSFYITMLSLEIIDYDDDKYENDDALILEMIITERDGFVCRYKFYFNENYTSRSFYTINGVGDFYIEIDRVLKLINDTELVLNNEFVDRDARE